MKPTFVMLGRLVLSYVIGFAAGAVPAIMLGGAVGVAVMLAGFIIALPFLGVAAAALGLFSRTIERNLLAWCILAPVAVTAAWLAAEYFENYGPRGYSLFNYLALRSVFDIAFLAGIVASAASFSFYRMQRKASETAHRPLPPVGLA